ncbi:MAG: thiamine pyrophosphate-binding protein [Rhodospirillales bacterium]|nr:thiamine pyrophosphate-binding protein [Rhodospirillales bacterium]
MTTMPQDAADRPSQTPYDRARIVATLGGLDSALASGALDPVIEVTLAEALVLGLLKQGVRKYFAIFGHGNTALGEILRQYEEAGAVRVLQFRNEIAMAHAATQLSWQYGEIPAVATSIGPGALQAFAASLAAASNGVGVYHLYGDETTHGEGPNMQQVPGRRQGSYGALTAMMGANYVLHTPEALRDALRLGAATVGHPYKAAPFYLLLPINTQPATVRVNLATLPARVTAPPVAPVADDIYRDAVVRIAAVDRIVLKAGGGTRRHAVAVRALAERIGAAVVLSPGSTGVLPDAHPLNMHVGGSKGSISGNHAMEAAELLLAMGVRAVCQSDCSGIGYPNAHAVINVNGDIDDVYHYANTLALTGDIGAIATRLIAALDAADYAISPGKRAWLDTCADKKREWAAFRQARIAAMPPVDATWASRVMTQPQAIEIAAEFAKSVGAVKLFDAGDVQANGFQTVRDDAPFETFTESGASYMGYAVSALLAAGAADKPVYAMAFTGDGSFTMNPQVLIDAIEHRVRGMIVLFDNRRMAAITGLQHAQYGREFRTSDGVAVNYLQFASSVEGVLAVDGGTTPDQLRAALVKAHAHSALSLVHVRVYGGADPVGGLGAHGKWNVGNWCDDVQARHLEQSI